MAASKDINLFDILPGTIWSDIYKRKRWYYNQKELYNLNAETRESLLDMIKFGQLKLLHGIVYTDVYSGSIFDKRLTEIPIVIDSKYFDGKKVKQVSAGGNYSLFICDDNSIYSTGINYCGNLAIPGLEDDIDHPQLINMDSFEGKTVIQIVAGKYHSFFLCDDGSAYASGSYKDILGIGAIPEEYSHNGYVETPTPVDRSLMKNPKIVQISTNDSQTFFLCEDGLVYFCGTTPIPESNKDGDKVYTPVGIDNTNMEGKRVIQLVTRADTMSPNSSFTVFLCDDNTVYLVGYSFLISFVSTIPIQAPVPVINNSKIMQIVLSKSIIFYLYENGIVLFSTGDIRQLHYLKWYTFNIYNKKIVQLSANKYEIIFLCQDGTAYISKYTSRNGIPGIPKLIEMNDKPIVQVSLSNSHALYLT